jgi:hypothetical protein
MPYTVIDPTTLVTCFERWVLDEVAIRPISLRSGGWENWAATQFAYWLNHTRGGGEGFDVQSEVRANAGDGMSVYEDNRSIADLVFNALTSAVPCPAEF